MKTCQTCPNDLVCHDLGECQQPPPGLPQTLQTALVFAARYVHHRDTGGTLQVTMALSGCWDQLDSQTQQQILRESHEATCNLSDWETFRKNHR